jgi:hypothetical protein
LVAPRVGDVTPNWVNNLFVPLLFFCLLLYLSFVSLMFQTYCSTSVSV